MPSIADMDPLDILEWRIAKAERRHAETLSGEDLDELNELRRRHWKMTGPITVRLGRHIDWDRPELEGLMQRLEAEHQEWNDVGSTTRDRENARMGAPEPDHPAPGRADRLHPDSDVVSVPDRAGAHGRNPQHPKRSP